MALKIEDLAVTDVARKPAGYAAKTKNGDVQLELISFKVSYQGGAPEQLSDVPFPSGTTAEDLVHWCAEGIFDNQGQLRGPDQDPPIIGGGERRRLHERSQKSGMHP